MRKYFYFVLLCTLCTLCISCSDDDDDNNVPLVGTWNNTNKQAELKSVSFDSSAKCIETRKSEGITDYANYTYKIEEVKDTKVTKVHLQFINSTSNKAYSNKSVTYKITNNTLEYEGNKFTK